MTTQEVVQEADDFIDRSYQTELNYQQAIYILLKEQTALLVEIRTAIEKLGDKA